MHSEKKMSKEDTWRPSDLRRHLRERDVSSDNIRSREENERRHRFGESTERRHRDPDVTKRDKRESEDKKEKHAERRKEGSHTQRSEKEREKRHEWDSEKIRMIDDYLGDREKKREREEKHERRRERERHKSREREKPREEERYGEKDKEKSREDREKERRRKEQDREHRSERRMHGETGERRRHHGEQQPEEESDRRHRTHNEDPKKDKDSHERHRERKHSERKEEREYKEEQRRHREEREHKHRDRGHHDEKVKHKSKSKEHHKVKDIGEVGRTEGESSQMISEKEREKSREIRKKEEEDAEVGQSEKSHRDRGTSTRRMSAGSQRRHQKREAVAKGDGMKTRQWRADRGDAKDRAVNTEESPQEEYEDDFEVYDEDFEEMDEGAKESEDEQSRQPKAETEESEVLTTKQKKEIQAIQKAMAEENERAETALSRRSTSREEEVTPRCSAVLKSSEKNEESRARRGKFIDFVAAKQREINQKVASKQKKRSNDLLRLIDLDFSVTFCLLDLPPVSEYDLYIKSFGNANTKQAYTQCNEDNTDQEIQTEVIELGEKWTQHPPDYPDACGDPNLPKKAQHGTRRNINLDSQHLMSFLHSASQVVIALLEENQPEKKSLEKSKTQADSLSFADGSFQLNTQLSFLHGRQISLVHFSQVQKNIMLSVHKPMAKRSTVRLDGSTIICVWNIRKPFRPQSILTYESEVLCCCFNLGKATLVFAGTSVGSVVLWDLREPTSNHYSLKIGAIEWILRQPTFSTDGVMAASAHFSPVTSVEVVSSASPGEKGTEVLHLTIEERVSFQLASLDENQVLNIWVVVEIPNASQAGSTADLGLRPGSKVKLLHSSSLLTAQRSSARDAGTTWSPQTLLLKFHPTNSNHFFVGTNLGLVSHETSYGLKELPKFYKFQDDVERPVDVTSIHFSPFRSHLFLVGCGDGSIRLQTITKEHPVAEWLSSTSGNPVVSLQWSQNRPAVFCVLDGASNLYIWDLSKNDAKPVIAEKFNADRVAAAAVFGTSGQDNVHSGIALAHESGKIELHYFSRSFTTSVPEEEEKLESLIAEAF